MSLINQMLQDLDKRQSGADVNPLSSVRAVPRQHSMKPVWALLALLLAIAGALGWLFWDRYSPQRGTTAVQPPVPIEPAAVAKAPPPAPATRVPPPEPAEDAPSPPPEASLPAAPAVKAPAAPAAAPAPKPPAPKPAPAQPRRAGARHPAAVVSKQVREPTPQQRAEAEYRKAVSLAQQGRTPEAINGLEQALRIDPRHAAATQTLIALLLESKRFGDAERKLQEALDLDLAQPDLAMTLARLQLERGDTAAAITTLDRSQHAAANRPQYYGFMAALLQREGYHREAIVQYRQALRLSPGNAVWLMGLGISLQAEKNYREAREAYSRARASGSLSPELQAFVEQRLRQLGQSAN
ncbi:MAG: tetratricopeptide repeat protein [Pseudomonadota bacterium]